MFGTGRAYDQIRNTVCYSNLNVKIAPTHAGISVGPDGGSHQMLEDVSLMRGLPGIRSRTATHSTHTGSAPARSSQTAEPKPPTTECSSAVTTQRVFATDSRMVAASSCEKGS